MHVDNLVVLSTVRRFGLGDPDWKRSSKLPKHATANALPWILDLIGHSLPASLKLWIDDVLRRTFSPMPQGKAGLLQGGPTLVLVTSGGGHAVERATRRGFMSNPVLNLIWLVFSDF